MTLESQCCNLIQAKRLKELGVLQEEEWRFVVGYDGLYEVSSSGKVKPKKRAGSKGSLLTPQEDRGYLRVVLSKKGVSRYVGVHRLVAAAFIDNPDNKPEVNHLDGNRQNNHYTNLAWCTREENEYHKKNVSGSNNRGNKNPNFRRGKGLLYPSHKLTQSLVDLGIPRWAIRLDWLSFMLPTLGIKRCKSNNGNGSDYHWLEYRSQDWSDLNEASLLAKFLIYLLEEKVITPSEVNNKLNQ
jgi:hypothetical protein